MRSTTAAVILALCAALAAGCSERASRLTGNERLLRGVADLGTSYVSDTLVDRDTYLSPTVTLLKGATLLAGQLDGFEARSLLRTATWTLPDTNALIDAVRFRIEYDARIDQDLSLDFALALHVAGAAWDSTSVTWPGPSLGTRLGSAGFGLAPYTIDLGAGAIDSVRAWAGSGASFPGFELSRETGSGLLGFLAGTGRIEVVYHTLSDATQKTATTLLPTDVTIYSPAPPSSGVSDSLVLGGMAQSEVLLHAPVAPSPSGFSINGAAFVAYVTSGAFGSADTSAEIRAYRVALPWTEGTPVDSINATPLTIIGAYRVGAPGDSIVIQVPVSVVLDWSQNPSTNHGILIRIVDAIYAPRIRLASRESAQPPRLRVTRTTPPPGRF